MIDKIASIVTNPTLVQFAQNTKACVTTESLFKAAGRPTFIMMDNKVDKKTRRYAAVKEGLYQLICLGIYLTLVSVVFKKYGFKLAQKIINNPDLLPGFKDVHEYEAYHKLSLMDKDKRATSNLLSKISDTLKVHPNDSKTLKQKLLTEDKPNTFHHGKGAIELSNLTGSVIGLALIASEVSNIVLHPIMRGLGLEKSSKVDNKKVVNK